MKWILVTASFGGDNFRASAERMLRQANRLHLFEQVVHVTEANLPEFAPLIWDKYQKYLVPNSVGYGFYSWKSEIVYTVLKANPDFGVMYIDAGCEINTNFIARQRLKFFMMKAKNGHFFHVLNYPEKAYTKNKVMEYFQLSPRDRESPQIQATWFLLSGNLGREISRKWSSSTLESIQLSNDEIGIEDESFIQHRYDQSLLSCVVKSLRIQPTTHRPCFLPVSFKSRVRCFIHPVWSARNRSGIPIQSKGLERELK